MIDRILLLTLLVGLLACSNDGDDEKITNRPPVSDFEVTDATDKIRLQGDISYDVDGDALSYTWSTTGPIAINNAHQALTYFNIAEGTVGGTAEITLEVSDGVSTNASTQSVSVPAWSHVRAFGLGKSLEAEASNNTSYEWYYDQGNSGPFSGINCGPTSVTMAIKWAAESFSKTPEDARHVYRPGGGWWYTDDIANYLADQEVNHWTIALSSLEPLKEEIDNGNVAILCLDMYYVNYNADGKQRFDKFYVTSGTGWGHFIVIKGYKEVDGQTFFEAYDPYSLGSRYEDDSMKGKDRYYKLADLDQATNVWWDYAIVVSRNASGGGRKKVDDKEVVPMPGR